MGAGSSRIARRRLIGACAASFAAIGLIRAQVRAAQFEFKCGSELAQDHPSVVRAEQMWAAIEQESGGRIRGQVFPNNVLGGESAMLAQLRVAALPFLIVNPGALSAIVPSANIVNIGFAFRDKDEAVAVMDGRLGEYIRKDAAARGLYLFRTMGDDGMYQVATNLRAVRTPADLGGLKIRVPQSKISVDLFKELGAGPTPINYAEVYSSLQTRIIDGQAAPLLAIEKSRFYEVEKYLSLTNHAWSGQWLMANADVWNSVPPDLQTIVERNQTKFALLQRRDSAAEQKELVAKMIAHGLAVNEVDQAPFRARLRAYYATWSAEFGANQWGLLESGINRKLA